MASVPSAHLVLFIAAVVVSASIAGVLTQSAQRVGTSVKESQVEYAKDLQSEVAILNDPGSPNATYDAANETLTLYLKNVGARTLPSEPADVQVLVNGTYQAVTGTTVVDASEWRPTTVVVVTVPVSLPSDARTRIVVVVSGGRDRFVFTTP